MDNRLPNSNYKALCLMESNSVRFPLALSIYDDWRSRQRATASLKYHGKTFQGFKAKPLQDISIDVHKEMHENNFQFVSLTYCMCERSLYLYEFD